MIFVPHAPCLAGYQSVEAAHRVDECGTKFSKKSAKTPATVVQ